jgi:hypothetical protein
VLQLLASYNTKTISYTFDDSKDQLTCNNTRIQAQNIENQNTYITKKTAKQKLCFEISNHQK